VGYNGVVVRTPPHSAYSESVRRGPVRPPPVRGGRRADVADDFSPPACRCGPLSGISGHFPHSSNYFRSIDSTSGLPRKPQTKRRSTTAYEVQRFRQSAVVFPHFHGISHFPTPKWRLKLLPVPVLTRNSDSAHPVSY